MKQADINKVRNVLAKHMGSKVRVRTNRGRHRIDIKEGIISQTYPSIFVIQLEGENPHDLVKNLSFSYTDILTKDVQLSLI